MLISAIEMMSSCNKHLNCLRMTHLYRESHVISVTDEFKCLRMTHLCRETWHPVTNSSNVSGWLISAESMASCNKQFKCLRHLNCLLQDAMLSLCRDESSWTHLNCLLQDAVLSNKQFKCRDESSWETFELFVTGCHVSLREHESSCRQTVWTVSGCHAHLCRDESNSPETFELFVTGCQDVSLQRWVILRHLNCLLQDAMLSLCNRDESSWDIWTVCYRMPCLSLRDESSCRHLNCLLQDTMLSLQRWVILRHLNCLSTGCSCLSAEMTWHPVTFEQFKCLQDDSSLQREHESSCRQTVEMFVTGCHLSAEMSHPETFELFATGCHVISTEMTWHPVDIWTVQMSQDAMLSL